MYPRAKHCCFITLLCIFFLMTTKEFPQGMLPRLISRNLNWWLPLLIFFQDSWEHRLNTRSSLDDRRSLWRLHARRHCQVRTFHSVTSSWGEQLQAKSKTVYRGEIPVTLSFILPNITWTRLALLVLLGSVHLPASTWLCLFCVQFWRVEDCGKISEQPTAELLSRVWG